MLGHSAARTGVLVERRAGPPLTCQLMDCTLVQIYLLETMRWLKANMIIAFRYILSILAYIPYHGWKKGKN